MGIDGIFRSPMLNEKQKKVLYEAVIALRSGQAGPVSAFEYMAPFVGSGLDVKIDFATMAAIGTPLVFLQRSIPMHPALSPRQTTVASLLARGLSNKAIARELGISVATVKDHVHAILVATGTASRTQVVALFHGEKTRY